MRKSDMFSVFLDAVNVSSVALILTICFQMSHNALSDWRKICIALLSFVVAFCYKKINSALLVLGGSLLGYLLTFIGYEINAIRNDSFFEM